MDVTCQIGQTARVQDGPYMRKILIYFSVGLVLPLMIFQTRAQAAAAYPANGLYRAVVPVASAGAQARDRAFTQALYVVLARLSSQTSGDLQALASELPPPSTLVKDYSYLGGVDQHYRLRVRFDASAVSGLARALGLSIWPGPRPPVLAIISVNGRPLGHAATAALVSVGVDRGLRFVLPGPVSPDPSALIQGDPQALDALAKDYRTGLALIGTIRNGQATWTLVIGGQVATWQEQGIAAIDMIQAGAVQAANQLLQRFAATPGVGAAGLTGSLWVSGLQSATDFARLMFLLRSDPRIRTVQPQQAQANGLQLSLGLDAPLTVITDDLAASGHLVMAPTHRGTEMALRWVR